MEMLVGDRGRFLGTARVDVNMMYFEEVRSDMVRDEVLMAVMLMPGSQSCVYVRLPLWCCCSKGSSPRSPTARMILTER